MLPFRINVFITVDGIVLIVCLTVEDIPPNNNKTLFQHVPSRKLRSENSEVKTLEDVNTVLLCLLTALHRTVFIKP